MPFTARLKSKWSFMLLPVAAVLLACTAARADTSDVQTFQNAPLPADMTVPTGPVKPGSITMDDVLKAHPPKPQLTIMPPGSAIPPNTGAPLLTPPARESSTSLMMMQGLKSVLQQSGASATPLLKAPILPGNEANAQQRALAASASQAPQSVNSVTYQPGQAPKDLTTLIPPPPGAATPVATPAEAVAATAEPAQMASGDCEPTSTTWTKTCVEAGYPENFIGAVQGETHLNCPGSTLQDTWLSNTCSPPQGEPVPAAFAPLSAPMNPELAQQASGEASCGSANGLAADNAPATDLCMSGEATPVTGSGPWRWSCKGSNNGMTVSCAATANPHPATVASVAAVETASAPTQEASVPVVEDGVCGPVEGIGTDRAPMDNLCNKGTASRVSGEGPWTWACSGSNGGQAVACTAPRITDGACGSSANSATDDMPTADLCAAGYASAVTGKGPWNWTCSGLYGGQAATCAAAPKQDAVCGGGRR